MKISEKQSKILISLVHTAGQEILKIYNNKIIKNYKKDNTPVTNADLKANEIICRGLKINFPKIPIISEENDKNKSTKKKNFWLVDPLDGTKEFLKKNGEFTVNIGLIENGKPIYGIIYMPVKNKLYFTKENSSYFTKLTKKGGIKDLKKIKIKKRKKNIIVISRSHSLAKKEMIKAKKMIFKKFNANKILRSGSSIKLCYIAHGLANVYPRYGTTMEWDTAAGDAILRFAGGRIRTLDRKILRYGKKKYKNTSFIAKG
ncbi:3'(2'),5'-bisphosphate nucleotidase CysQ [Pelagibacteraceae bacterium]|nr:3'(2'),5'-bisphosphate nucleotidase CysQ [Pelagibacteraceae bacterium]